MLRIILAVVTASVPSCGAVSAGPVNVCQDKRSYIYNSTKACKRNDKRIDFYTTINFTRHPRDCETTCVIATFDEGRLVLRTSPRHVDCWFHFQANQGWILYAADPETVGDGDASDSHHNIRVPTMDGHLVLLPWSISRSQTMIRVRMTQTW
jgi:hypothetical protein